MKTYLQFAIYFLAFETFHCQVDEFNPNGTSGDQAWYTTYLPLPKNETTPKETNSTSDVVMNDSKVEHPSPSHSQPVPDKTKTKYWISPASSLSNVIPTTIVIVKNRTKHTEKGSPTASASHHPPNSTKAWDLNFQPVGCYRDSYVTPRPLPEMIGNFASSFNPSNPNKTIMACARVAKERGFHFFGLQNKAECRSGNGSEKTFGRDGPSLDCSQGVGESGANFVYKFDGEVPVKCKECGEPRMFCFPGNALVETRESGAKRMSELQVGEEIKAYGNDGNIVYSRVIAFLHRNSLVQAAFYKIFVSGNRMHSITVSGKHLLFKKGISENSITATFASEINPGDFLMLGSKHGNLLSLQVVKVTMVTEKGLYAPLTNEGTLFVNNVLTSCYAHWPSHKLAHLAMAPLRILTRIANILGPVFRDFSPVGFGSVVRRQNDNEIHWYSSVLLDLAKRVKISSFIAT